MVSITVLLPIPYITQLLTSTYAADVLQDLKFRLTTHLQQQLFFVTVPFYLNCRWWKLVQSKLCAAELLLSFAVTKCSQCSTKFSLGLHPSCFIQLSMVYPTLPPSWSQCRAWTGEKFSNFLLLRGKSGALSHVVQRVHSMRVKSMSTCTSTERRDKWEG